MKCVKCNVSGCSCLFQIKKPQPICKKCAGTAQMEELAEINSIEKETMTDVFTVANQHSLLGTTKMQHLRDLARSVAHVQGSFAELGVYKGGSAFLLASDHKERMLHLFDTFEGIPVSGNNDKHKVGDFNDTSLEAVQKLLDSKKVLFHQGLFPDTVKGLEFEKYAFVHVDADQYQSTLDACKYFWPRMAVGGVMLFDDYEFVNCPGVKKALSEFAAANDVAIQNQGHYQAVFQKTDRPQVMLRSACKGIGDHICSQYACAGIAAAGYDVFYYGKHPMWYERVKEPHVTVINAEQVSIPDGAIDIGARYTEQLIKADCRKQWYCDNFAIAKKLPAGSVKPLRPKRDLAIKTPRDDAGKYVVMFASSVYKVRDWTPQHWVDLVGLFANEGIKVVAIDGPNQERRLKAAFGNVAHNCLFVWGYDAKDISDLILQSKGFIGIDSGMTHFAAMLEVPTVAITAALPAFMVFGLTDVTAIEPVGIPCSPCRFIHNGGKGYRAACDRGCTAIQSITPQRVFETAMKVMK